MPTRLEVYDCPICKDAGWLRVDYPRGHPQFGKLEMCECLRTKTNQRTRENLQNLSSMTETEQHLKLVDIAISGKGTKALLAACKKMIDAPEGLVTIWGGTGNGKTLAMQAVVNELLDHNVQAVYVTAFDLVSFIREAFNQEEGEINSGSAYERIQRFEKVQVLCLDELDKIFPLTNWEQRQLTDLIDRRYRGAIDGSLGTMIAMNESPNVLDAHLRSRLLDKQFVVIENNDPDQRLL